MDINPSVEMVIDEELRLVEVRYLNEAADRIGQPVERRGMHLDEFIQAMLSQSVRYGYIKPNGAQAVVAFTIVPLRENRVGAQAVMTEVFESMERTMQSRGLPS
jgi:hypothetical protein